MPQGSVLGPLLFLLYINDFKNCTSSLDLHLFADDSNLFFSHKNLEQLEMIINVELAHVQTWLSTSKLSLNIDKSNYVLFHPPQKKVNISIKLNINNTSLKEKPCIESPGIMLDFDLVTFHVRIFMFKFHNKLLPAVFDNYFLLTSKVHTYNTRLSSNHAYSLPTARTNYGIFNIGYTGAKVWNSIEAEFKNLSFKAFKERLKNSFVSKY